MTYAIKSQESAKFTACIQIGWLDGVMAVV